MPFSTMPQNYVSITVGAASLAITGVLLLQYSTRNRFKHTPKALPSPLKTIIPQLSPSALATIPYPPDFFPGARDVPTAYGSIRVYEWGPEGGERVFLVHGDTTPSPVLGPIAEGLVEAGYRVMLLDLWGRGYSDAPLDARYDKRLFVSQLLMALASSPALWMDPGVGFHLVGYSLGGGIAMAFAASFHNLVRSLVLLGPAGVLADVPSAYKAAFVHSELRFPVWYVRRNMLGTFIDDAPEEEKEVSKASPRIIDALAANLWQYRNHSGFVHAFSNTVKYGPIMHQHEDWQKVCDILCRRNAQVLNDYGTDHLLSRGSLLAVFGEQDTIIPADHVTQVLRQMMGQSERLVVRTVPGGHAFVLSNSREVLEQILGFLADLRARDR